MKEMVNRNLPEIRPHILYDLSKYTAFAEVSMLVLHACCRGGLILI